MFTRKVTIVNKSGLHARPAADLVRMAKQFASGITIQTENKTADAKSILQLLTLGISQGASVTVTTQGPDGEEALNMLCNFIETGLGEQ